MANVFMAIESKMNRGPIGRPSPSSGAKRIGGWLWVSILLCIALAVGGWYYFSSQTDQDSQALEAGQEEVIINSGEYQAVFLDNGQVYFGKLERSRSDFYILTDVFYLQSGVAVEQTANLSLTKLGSEAHGPEDKMEINKEHILFIEDMKNDSKVVQAIEQYKSSKN
ncbi:hypothetical protein HY733_02525 [Candidatus Uhrbacteria bacterium]|nr:hypothetical protein [Candidatus Uhrbacteria bacterium]